MIIAVDFDGTIVEHEFPKIGEPIKGAFETLKELKKRGHKLILWTCREDIEAGNFLTEAVEYCKKNGIEFDAVNDNVKPYLDNIYTNTRKVYADLYIDDKNFTSVKIIDVIADVNIDWSVINKNIK